MSGRCAIHVPSCGRQTCLLLLVTLLLPQSWPLLIKVYWAIQYGMKVCICLGLSDFSFSYRNIVGTGGFSGRAIMRPQDVVLLDMPSSHSHSHFTLAWFDSSPLHPPSHLPIQLGLLLPLSTCHSLTHSPLPCLAVLHSHQALKASAQYFSLVCFFPSPLPLVHSLTLPQQVSSTIHGSLVVWVIWVFIECES